MYNFIVNTVYGVPSIRWQVQVCRGNSESDITTIGAVWSISIL